MKVMLVDDEPLALRHMSAILSNDDKIEIIGAYTDPESAIAIARDEKPQLVFMDIELPVMSGLEAAEKMLQIDPTIRVVFVTAYSHYALEAFELNALDYLLKPVKSERVRWALNRVQESMANVQTQASPASGEAAHTLLRIMGPVELERPGQVPLRLAWRTQKSQEMFLLLLQQAGQLIRKDTIIDHLWPLLNPEKAYTNLYTTAYQLRKTLKQYELDIRLISAEDGYSLEIGAIRIDAQEWEEGVRSAPEINGLTAAHHLSLLALNRGAYLQGLESAWMIDRRSQLDALWIHHVCKVIRYLCGEQAYRDAADWCRELQQRHPNDAQSYELLMRIYAATGDYTSASEQYKLLCQMLAQHFGVEPAPDLKRWYVKHVNTLEA